VRYGMMMNAARSVLLLIGSTFNPLAATSSTWGVNMGVSTAVNVARSFDLDAPAVTASSCGQTCARTVDEPIFLVRKRKVRGITLGIQKYLLTCGFTSAKVSDVPDSARRPGLGTESVERSRKA